jgi:hypothetical protein
MTFQGYDAGKLFGMSVVTGRNEIIFPEEQNNSDFLFGRSIQNKVQYLVSAFHE